MTGFFGKIGKGIEHLGQQIGNEVKDHLSGNPRPDPTKFADGSPVPSSSGYNQSSVPNGSGAPGGTAAPGGSSYGSAAGFTSQQQAQLQNALSASGVWDTIQGLGSDAWDVVAKLLPKNADGSIDWGGALKDVAGWVDKNKTFIADTIAGIQQGKRQEQADKYAKDAFDQAKDQYAAKQPLRDAGMAGMLDPSKNAPDLTQIGKLATAGQGQHLAAPLPLGNNLQSIQNIAGELPAAKPIPLAGGPMSSAPQAPAAAIPLAPQPYVPQRQGASTAPAATSPSTPPTPATPGPLAPPALPIALQGPPTPPPKYKLPYTQQLAPIPLAAQ